MQVRVVSFEEALDKDSSERASPSPDNISQLTKAVDTLEYNQSDPYILYGHALDLAPFVDRDSAFQAEDFYTGTLQSMREAGSLLGLPSRVTLQLIFYDKQAFDQAGVLYPEPGWTWDEFLSKAQALTIKDGDQVLQWGMLEFPGTHSTLSYIQGQAGPLVDQTMVSAAPLLDEPRVAQAVHWYVDLYLKDQVMPDIEQSERARLIEEAQAAMWSDVSIFWPFRSQDRDLGLVPYPVNDPQSHSSLFYLESLVMSAGTAHPDESWRWLNFLTRQYLDFGDTAVPARRSTAERSGYWELLEKELAVVYRFALAHGFSQWGLDPVTSPLYEAIDDILNGNSDVETALAEAQSKARLFLRSPGQEQKQVTPVPTFTPLPALPETTIVFVPVNDATLIAYRHLAELFHEEHPDVVVEIQPLGTTPPLPTALSEKADCAAIYTFAISPQERATMLSLEPFLDSDTELDLGDFYLVDRFQYAGQLWALPAEHFPKVIIYNKELFDAAGVAYPTPDWTLKDFADMAVALTDGAGEPYGFVSAVFEKSDLMFFLEQAGALLVDTQGDNVDFLFNTPTTRAAMQWYTDLSRVYEAKPVFGTDNASRFEAVKDWDTLIRGGRAAMWTDYLGAHFVTSGSPFETDIAVGYVSLPKGPGHVDDSYTVGYYISTQATHPQVCWEWIKFLSTQTEQIEGVPARRSLAESAAFQRQVGEEKAAALLQSFTDVERVTLLQGHSIPDWAARPLNWLAQAFDAIVDEELSVDEALAQVQQRADAYRDCLAEQDGFDDPKVWEMCATYPGGTNGP
jgi:multiple sugar transport system substrate-binding protein